MDQGSQEQRSNKDETPSTTALEELVQLGFELVTQWTIKGIKIGPTSFKWQDHGGWLYAFIVEGTVRYIGLTERVLRSRMGDYSHTNNSQNNRIRQLIMSELFAGRPVEIWGWKEGNIAALRKEERRLLDTYCPSWNRM